jgi:hypothetical protein
MPRNVRFAIAAVAGALALGGIAVANAANDRTEQENETTADLTDGSTRSFVAGAAGSVEVTRNGDALTVARTAPNAGWVVEVEATTGREVEVQFTNGDRRVDFNAELEDGELRVRVRDRDDDDDVPGTTTPTTPDDTVPSTTTPTVPDDDDDDVDDDGDADDDIDNSGPGNAHDDDVDDVDNSGPGNADHDNSGPGNADDPDDDDNSGPGHGDEDGDDDNSGPGSGD